MMLFLKNQWRYCLTAIMFFTRIPVSLADFKESDLNKATRYFPLVGLLVGGVGALIFWLAHHILPLDLALLLSMVATILLTGAFHEDGLADSMDGLGGGFGREQVLTIMTDSRIGSYGAISIILILLIKFQALSHQAVLTIPIILVAGHALSRFCAVLVMYAQSYVKAEGKSKPLATSISVAELMVAASFGLMPLTFFAAHQLLALLPVLLVWLWFSAKIKACIGGYTGDCLGAMQQLTEVAFYIGLLATASFA